MIHIVDAHAHLWDTSLLRYPWLEEFPPLAAPHTFEDYKNVTGALSDVVFDGAIVVQADVATDLALDECALIAKMVGSAPQLGFVAYAPLEEGHSVSKVLDQLAENSFVVGVRRAVQNEPTEMLTSPGYISGLTEAVKRGLCVDLCVRSFQLSAAYEAVAAVVEKFPNARFIIDHAGKPPAPEQEAAWRSWSTDLAKVAELPAAYCKLSGLLTEYDASVPPETAMPSINHILDVFGPERTLFGTDWPVVELAAEVGTWIELVRSALEQRSNRYERIWGRNSLEVYGLNKNEKQ